MRLGMTDGPSRSPPGCCPQPVLATGLSFALRDNWAYRADRPMIVGFGPKRDFMTFLWLAVAPAQRTGCCPGLRSAPPQQGRIVTV